MNVPGGWELVVAVSAMLAVPVCVILWLAPRSSLSRSRRFSAVSSGGLSPMLVVLAIVVASWPVRADATRYELESGSQPAAQLEARLADPAQAPRLAGHPLCGVPLLAPLHYVQDTALRRGCAGPNARSMSIAFGLLLLAGAGAAWGRRPETDPQQQLTD